jgi:DNA-binding CsgD family transcriptional regulator
VRAELYVVAHAVFNRYFASFERGTAALGRTLSPREIDCLRLISVGKSDDDIGETLAISARTVRFHIDAAKAKLGAANRVTAVAMALREQLIALIAAVALATTAGASASPAVTIWYYVS